MATPFYVDNLVGAPFDTFPPHVPDVGAAYINDTGGGAGAIRIGPSGDCWTQGPSFFTPASCHNLVVPPTPDYYMRGILHKVTMSHQIGIGIRLQTGKFYGLLYNSATPGLELSEVTLGSPNTATILATYALDLSVAGDTPITVQAQGAGGSTILHVSINDVLQAPVAALTPLDLAGRLVIYEMFGNGGDPALSIHLRSLTAGPLANVHLFTGYTLKSRAKRKSKAGSFLVGPSLPLGNQGNTQVVPYVK